MPRFPRYARRVGRLPGSVFEAYRPAMAARGADLVRLHIGDSHRPPPYAIPVDRAFVRSRPGVHRYGDTFGVAALRETLAAKLRDDDAIPAEASTVLVTAGATNALAVTAQTLFEPGDEVLVLAPYWPFWRGMVRAAGADVVEVPFYTEFDESADAADVATRVERRVNRNTAAVYLNTPNNPSGRVLTPAQVAAVADVARRHDLWLISDEAYDGMAYDGRVHTCPASLPGMHERTISIFTFSKVYMFAGLRLGCVTTARETIEALNRTLVHMLYSVSTLAQEMMVDPVRSRARWRRAFVEACARTRDRVVEALAVDVPTPQGAYYVFFDAAPWLGGRDFEALVRECIAAGVSVAPGGDFGADYATWLRLCYAGEPEDRVIEGIARLNAVLARSGRR